MLTTVLEVLRNGVNRLLKGEESAHSWNTQIINHNNKPIQSDDSKVDAKRCNTATGDNTAGDTTTLIFFYCFKAKP